ncbi:MAG: polysaccharide deacetylase family protein [Candidatus Saccharibacteria bacterium]|nr:polysaccharide deacetylase family protein [Candidatus Saccharibacteria bacterium]
MKKSVDVIIEKRWVRRRMELRPVFAFLMSGLFTVLIISGVQFIEANVGENDAETKTRVIDGIETTVPDFVELDTISEGRKLESPETPVATDSGGSSEIAPVGGSRTVYLTFDDGPGEYTARLLDILGKYNVKATFFVTCRGSDDLIRREFSEGHTVALHTCSHNYAIYQSVETYFNDLNAISDRVLRITGVSPKLLRFPGGASNTISAKYNKGIMSVLTAEVERRGYKYFDWNVTSGDAGNTSSSDAVYQNVINGVNRRGNGSYSVVLQHDIKDFSVNAVERIIKYGLSNGYKFETLSVNSPVTHHRVNN